MKNILKIDLFNSCLNLIKSMKLFVDDKQEISNEFILFHKIKTLINTTTSNPNKPIYLRIGKDGIDMIDYQT